MRRGAYVYRRGRALMSQFVTSKVGISRCRRDGENAAFRSSTRFGSRRSRATFAAAFLGVALWGCGRKAPRAESRDVARSRPFASGMAVPPASASPPVNSAAPLPRDACTKTVTGGVVLKDCPPSWSAAEQECKQAKETRAIRVIEQCRGFNEFHSNTVDTGLECFYPLSGGAAVAGDHWYAIGEHSKICEGDIPSAPRDGCVARWCGPPLSMRKLQRTPVPLEKAIRIDWSQRRCGERIVLDCVLADGTCPTWGESPEQLCERGWNQVTICDGKDGRHSIGMGEGTFFFDRDRASPTALKGLIDRPDVTCAGPIVDQSDYEVACRSYECREPAKAH